ncbi:MAG: L-type lectin-domain containing protein [Bacteroidota bacterium]|jgi:hypothetical protein
MRFFLFIIILTFSKHYLGQVLSLNGTALTVVGGSPSSCTAGGYKLLQSAAVGAGSNCVTFTSNAFQNGAVWACSPIDLNQSFRINFTINFGSNTGTGDGMAFLLQTEGMPQVIGGRAGGIGYAQGDGNGCLGGTCPITPSIAVEFDTWDNSATGINDVACHHVSIQKNGVMNSTNALVSPTCMLSGGTSVVDGADHTVCITWDPSLNKYTVFFDAVQVVVYSGDIRTNFTNPSSVYWGFTGASGGLTQTQKICGVAIQTNIASPSCSAVLPISLGNVQFNCSAENPNIIWHTFSEQNTSFFLVEGSEDGITWKNLCHINAAGNSLTEHIYNCAIDGFYGRYLRLIQSDWDGKLNYFGPYINECGQVNGIKIFQPIEDLSSFSVLADRTLNCEFEIIDPKGNKIAEFPARINSGINHIPLNYIMDSGIYFVSIKDELGKIIFRKKISYYAE